MNDHLDSWIPHRGSMQLLTRILHTDAQSAEAEVTIAADGLFAGDRGVPAWIGLEYMAQTISAWASGRHRIEGGEPRMGLLLGSRRYVAEVDEFPFGALLKVQARCEIMGENGLGMFDCRIAMEGRDVASAQLAVYEPEDALAFLAGSTERSPA
jgi:predicted hotdog family 3-hydroxylacyl-ACP dehydratase